MTRPPVLEVRDLSVAYARGIGPWKHPNEVRILHDVSFALAAGERLAIVGESGSGKTTLLRALLRLLVPQRGQVLLQGTDLAILSRHELREQRSRVQMVFQDPLASLDPAMTVLNIVAEPLRRSGNIAADVQRERVTAQLVAVGLGQELLTRRPRQLSGGQAQRVAIARALIADPAVLICDEPVSALDVSTRAQVLQLLAEQSQQSGLALLMVTHDLAAARYLCDRIIVLQQGRVVESGNAAALLSNPRHAYTQQLLAAVLTTRYAARASASSS
jgi:ABC-type glutathione transport system ATPase component